MREWDEDDFDEEGSYCGPWLPPEDFVEMMSERASEEGKIEHDHYLRSERWRRIRLVPFNKTIPDECQDKHLPEKLEAELSGILNWALEGLKKWQETGLTKTKAVMAATQKYRDDMDLIANFICDYCEVGADQEVSNKNLYQAYCTWAQTNGERVMSQRLFSNASQERGFEQRKDMYGRHWIGISLDTQDV